MSSAKGSRAAYRSEVDGPRFWHDKGFEIVDVVAKVPAESGIPIPQLAIAWPLGRKAVTSVIIGIKSLSPRTILSESMQTVYNGC
jgi:aryl-alcohol dehydrogenase-like predicted oxidoreductase